MTATSSPSLAPSKRANRRSWWRDSVEAFAWLTAAGAAAVFLQSGGADWFSPTDVFNSLGRLLGIVAAVLVMMQLVLVSRNPVVERAFGHDRTTTLHTLSGKIAFVAMIAHMTIITLTHGQYDGRSYADQFIHQMQASWFMLAAVIGFWVFTLAVLVSIKPWRRAWKYQNWHAVHLLMYVAIILVIPHQFLEGSTFRDGGFAWWYWFTLYAIAIASLVVFRVLVPLVQYSKRGLRVQSVQRLDDGSTTVVIGGNVAAINARAGQFFLWRFLARGHWREAHPYSLSEAPDGSNLRITVKPSGDGSAAVADLKAGTRVMAEGPLGVFHEETRIGSSLVLIAAGIGITPIRSMLADAKADEAITVIVRARSRDEAPLLDEVERLADEKSATLHVIIGERGIGWASAGQPAALSTLVPSVDSADVFICGPKPWADAVEKDAVAAGVRADAIHREKFGW